jgi:DNA replication protein DnaC
MAKLVLDDWRLRPRTPQGRHDLLEILEGRYARKAALVTSQVPIADCFALISHATYADAIFDRLVHNADRIDLIGESMRRNRAKPQAQCQAKTQA